MTTGTKHTTNTLKKVAPTILIAHLLNPAG